MQEYNENYASASVEEQTIKRRAAFNWGIRGYRPDTSVMVQIINRRRTNKNAFIEGNSVRDEVRWLAIYCTDDFSNLQFLMRKTGLRYFQVKAFCAHYNVDLKKRNVIGGLN